MTRWTEEARADFVAKMRDWHSKPINRAKWYAGTFRSWTDERRAAHTRKMVEFWGDPERSAALREKARENGRKGAKGQMPRELRPAEYDAYRAVKRKGRLTRAEAVALILAARKPSQ
jgi:hypothetical protein